MESEGTSEPSEKLLFKTTILFIVHYETPNLLNSPMLFKSLGWGCSAVVECLSDIKQGPGLILRLEQNKPPLPFTP